jgi:hypothetical protein
VVTGAEVAGADEKRERMSCFMSFFGAAGACGVGAAEKSKEKSSFCGTGAGAVGMEREDEAVCELERRLCVFPVDAFRVAGEVVVTGGATNGAFALEIDVRGGEAGVGAGADDDEDAGTA